jgi:hypothetical protein
MKKSFLLLLILLCTGPVMAAGPVITAVSSSGISKSSVLMTWNTDIPSYSQMKYGRTIAYENSTSLDTNPATYHSKELNGLTPLAVYHYKFISSDVGGNVSESQDFTFCLVQLAWDAPDWEVGRYLVSYGNNSGNYVDPPIDVGTVLTYTFSIPVPPGFYYFGVKAELIPGYESDYSNEIHLTIGKEATSIFSIRATGITANQAVITWTTDEPSDSKVEYWSSTSYRSATALDPAMALSHSVVLSELLPNSRYNYRIVSRDSYGNIAISEDCEFPTADTIPPVISSIKKFNITDSGASITWITDEDADSQIYYGTTTAYDKSISIGSREKSHLIKLRGLTRYTTYHFQVRSSDAAGNLGYSSEDLIFTTAILPVSSDFSVDTKSDILLLNQLTGDISMWSLNDSGFAPSGSLPSLVNLGWEIAGIGDFDGDGKPDILWRHYGLGESFIWFMDGTRYLRGSYIEPQREMEYEIEGVGDLDRDGKADIIWRHNIKGTYSVWIMDGADRIRSENLDFPPRDLNWHLAGVGDFNRDDWNDLLWRNYASGKIQIDFMHGTTRYDSIPLDSPELNANLKIAGVGDYDGDGQMEILLLDGLTKEYQIWYVNGQTIQKQPLGQIPGLDGLVPDVAGQAAIGLDFDNDGNADLLWYDNRTGNNYVWLMNGVNYNGGTFLFEDKPANSRIVAAGDFNKDGMVDLVWHNDQTGDNLIWNMNGLTKTGQVSLPEPDTGWNTVWNIVGTGDFDKDGMVDLVWHNNQTGGNRICLMTGLITKAVGQSFEGYPGWKIVGTGDFDGDGMTDLLWSNPDTGESSIWFMNGTTRISEVSLERIADTNFKIATTGDFNRDGKIDIVWRNLATGENVVWFNDYFMDGNKLSKSNLPTVPGQRWRIISLGD